LKFELRRIGEFTKNAGLDEQKASAFAKKHLKEALKAQTSPFCVPRLLFPLQA
jgi:hypothetical protein